jgi:hypothetical protein
MDSLKLPTSTGPNDAKQRRRPSLTLVNEGLFRRKKKTPSKSIDHLDASLEESPNDNISKSSSNNRSEPKKGLKATKQVLTLKAGSNLLILEDILPKDCFSQILPVVHIKFIDPQQLQNQ